MKMKIVSLWQLWDLVFQYNSQLVQLVAAVYFIHL